MVLIVQSRRGRVRSLRVKVSLELKPFLWMARPTIDAGPALLDPTRSETDNVKLSSECLGISVSD